jgi:hypothetical protein
MKLLTPISLVLLFASTIDAAEYFVSKNGRDTHPGTSREAALATIQKGVDALQPGDTLTIGPGEYHEAVKRTDMGSLDKDTIIRAEIAGTVVLRGDVPAPVFRPVKGRRFVHVADFDFKGDVPVVNEIDTLTILKRMPNSAELDFIPGTFFHDAKAGKLYVSSSDLKPASAHRYSVSVKPDNGIYLVRPKRVVIEGITFTGFNAMTLVHYSKGTSGSVWGLFLLSPRQCAARDCSAFLNGFGIGLNCDEKGSGENVIERCKAWANNCQFSAGDMGGITVYRGRRDVIRDCEAWRNGMYGINIYGSGGAPPGADEGGNTPENKSRIIGCLAWGNHSADFKIKTGYEYYHTIERCVAPGLWHANHVTQCTIGKRTGESSNQDVTNANLSLEKDLDPQREFADPAHHDYRLQSTSRFRSASGDRGALPYGGKVFFVKTDGDDKADGLSVEHAWKSLAHAAQLLRRGDTLYLEAGQYQSSALTGLEGVAVRERGKPSGDAAPIRELKLIEPPAVRSVSATTANIEWRTSLPATCVVAWGETPLCEHSATLDVNHFGTWSLTGLKPGQRYHFAIRALSIPKDLAARIDAPPVQLGDAPVSFTTSPAQVAPRTYYVATDGDDSRNGTTRAEAWRTIRHAADFVNAGDTVLIAGGKYAERVRMRATGDRDAPITFKAMPGERVDLDGAEQSLNGAIVSTGKSHLRFDGFYFANFNLFPAEGWQPLRGADFLLDHGSDIEISRCFSDGRGGYTAVPVVASHVNRLTISNCVNTYKFGGGIYIWRCPNLLVHHCVFAEPMIHAFVLRNEKTQPSMLENCIFTDMLEKKAKLNIGLLCCDGEMQAFRNRNDCYFLRDCIPLKDRALNGGMTLDKLSPYLLDPIFADPMFAGDPGAKGNAADKSGFSPDRMMEPALKLDFDSFFATNPELVKRGIGLQPAAFKDFHFNKPAVDAQSRQ